jgi:hypothetical protein
MSDDCLHYKFEMENELDIGTWDLIWHLTLDIGILNELELYPFLYYPID